MRKEINTNSKLIGKKKKAGENTEQLQEDMRILREKIGKIDDDIRIVKDKLDSVMSMIPNAPHHNTHVGSSSKDNVVVRTWSPGQQREAWKTKDGKYEFCSKLLVEMYNEHYDCIEELKTRPWFDFLIFNDEYRLTGIHPFDASFEKECEFNELLWLLCKASGIPNMVRQKDYSKRFSFPCKLTFSYATGLNNQRFIKVAASN